MAISSTTVALIDLAVRAGITLFGLFQSAVEIAELEEAELVKLIEDSEKRLAKQMERLDNH